MRIGFGVVVALVLTGFAALLLHGTYDLQGPVIVEVTYYHGLHAGDVFVMAGWAVAMAAVGLLVRRGPAR